MREDRDEGLFSLPPGLRALAGLAAGALAILGAILGCLVGALLRWPLGGFEAGIGLALPYIIVAGGARLLWAGYMLSLVAVFWLIGAIG